MSTLKVSSLAARLGTGTIAVPTGNKILCTDVGSVYAPGTVIQVVYAGSGFVNQTITSATPVALTGMSATITPTKSTSKILIQGMVTASWSYVSSLHIFKNGVDLIPSHGTAANNQSGGDTALFTHYQSSQETARGNQVFSFPVLYLDSPGTTSPITYDFRANSGWSGGSVAFYFNNREAGDMQGSSTMMLLEVAG